MVKDRALFMTSLRSVIGDNSSLFQQIFEYLLRPVTVLVLGSEDSNLER